eukprot:scaffold57294_cov32-Tisochrysis_lutea.AAC.4
MALRIAYYCYYHYIGCGWQAVKRWKLQATLAYSNTMIGRGAQANAKGSLGKSAGARRGCG